MADLWALLAALALLGANAFFVAAEFALISARKDRLEAMAESGTAGARTVLQASAHLSHMLAASQLGITIASLLLGRLGEPAVAHLIEAPLEWANVPAVLLHPIAFAVSLAVVSVAHIIFGEMVPKNVSIAGPERVAILLVPPFLVFTTVMRPLISLFNWMANATLRLAGIEPKDEVEAAFTSGELAEMIADSRREGLLDEPESRRLYRTLRSAEATVADVVVPAADLVTVPMRPTVGQLSAAVVATGFSRFPVRGADGRLVGYLHVKDVLDLIDDPGLRIPPDRIRGLPEVPSDARLDEAVAALRTSRAHLARAVDGQGRSIGVVAMEDLIEAYVGTVRDITHHAVPSGQRVTRPAPTDANP